MTKKHATKIHLQQIEKNSDFLFSYIIFGHKSAGNFGYTVRRSLHSLFKHTDSLLHIKSLMRAEFGFLYGNIQ